MQRRGLIYAIDIGVGVGKMGEAAKRLGEEGLPFHMASSSLLALPDGRAYAQFSESDIFTYVWEWLRARRHIWKEAVLVGVEQQHSKSFFPRERQCLLVGNCFMDILKTLHAQGEGPPVVQLNPGWWREVSGTRVKGPAKAAAPRDQHDQNKHHSTSTYLARHQGAHERLLEVCGTRPMDDVVEACLMLEAMEKELDNLLRKPNRNHSVRLQFIGRNIPKEERYAPLEHIDRPVQGLLPSEHLASLYEAYLKTNEAQKKARDSKKLAKSASEMLSRYLVSPTTSKKQKKEE